MNSSKTFLDKYFEDSSEFKNMTFNINVNFKKLKLNKKQIIPIICMSCFIIVFITIGIIFSSLNSPEKAYTNFKNAIEQKNVNLLSEWLCFENGDKIDKNYLEKLLQLMDEESTYKTTVLEKLKNDVYIITGEKPREKGASLLDTLVAEAVANFDSNFNDFSIKPVGNVLFFFPKYRVVPKQYFIEVSCDTKGAKIYLDGREKGTILDTSSLLSFGPFVPGKYYNVEAKYSGKYVTLSDSDQVTLCHNFSNKNKILVELNLNPIYVAVEFDFEDAELIVDGKKTGIKVKEAKNFGPVSSNNEFAAMVALPIGTVKTQSKRVDTWSGKVTIPTLVANDDVNKPIFEKIANTINEFNKSWALAMSVEDVNRIVYCSDELKQYYQENRINEWKQNGKKYIGKPTKMIYNFGTLTLLKDGENFGFNVTIKEYWKFAVYSKDESPPNLDNIDEEEETHVYTMWWDNNSKCFKIKDISSKWFYDWPDDGRIEEYKLDEGSVIQ
ncbi:TcaA 3rd/4th domain-containing protein [Caldicellulosiruptor naganoensis]|uniref:Zinc ribbon domain-containing protein n=1 Tax=Caldicellulosiruptor naganoensis TaxID=29324 RepID=A0ABY7BK80_9FIRM|nr:hypothetical protein [Caldicellulosiruptor naganoensis]WAM31986.1 zinc ribbon domain-containing protein [Caldicellulosiruptor naganoensis]